MNGSVLPNVPSLDFTVALNKLIYPFLSFFGKIAIVVLLFALALVVYAQMKYQFRLRLTPLEIRRMKRMPIKMKLLDFLRWKIIDMYYVPKRKNDFREFGLTLYCGRQGSGKTISMIHYANWVHRRYPKCIIVTNFRYKYADFQMSGWRDFMDIRNGQDGVLFLLDEIHSEFSSDAWKDFPEDLLSEISQQRKQRIKIAATSQIFMRVVKQLREQSHSVVQCSTIGGRWTFVKEYDAKDYEVFCSSPSRDKHLKPFRKGSFVQSDFLRKCYDTYEKIERLKKMEFIPRHKRGA